MADNALKAIHERRLPSPVALIYGALPGKDIIVRSFMGYGIPDRLSVCVGMQSENIDLLKPLNSIRGEGAP